MQLKVVCHITNKKQQKMAVFFSIFSIFNIVINMWS